MDIGVEDLLSRFPWFGGLSEEYLLAVLETAKESYNPNLGRYRDIVLLHTANVLQQEQAGIIADVNLSQGKYSNTTKPVSYLESQLKELLNQEAVGALWIG